MQRNLLTQSILLPFESSVLCASDVRTSCRIVPGLTKEQLALCYRANDVTRAALDGLELAMGECQSQVQLHQETFMRQINVPLLIVSFSGIDGIVHH